MPGLLSPATPGSLPNLIATNPQASVVFELDGCLDGHRDPACSDGWRRTLRRLRRRARRSDFDPRAWNVAVHYRAGDALMGRRYLHRLIHPEYYRPALSAVLGALKAHGVAPAAVVVHIFPRARAPGLSARAFCPWPGRRGPRCLWLGNSNSTVSDARYMATADIFVLGRSSLSIAVASLSRGVTILNGWSVEPLPNHFEHVVPWRADGTGDSDLLLREIRRR